MIGSLLILGFTLSLDNFRTAIALGAVQPTWRRSVQVALMFGFWDGVAPLVGILIGRYWSESIGDTAEYVGAIALGAYGLYLVLRAWRNPEPELDQPWAVFGLLVPLSADNVLAGIRRRLPIASHVVSREFGASTARPTSSGGEPRYSSISSAL